MSSKEEKPYDAMDEEMSSLQKNATWELSDLPNEKKAIDCKWVDTKKDESNGKVRFKARLVAKAMHKIRE